jgi:hypothetical protein
MTLFRIATVKATGKKYLINYLDFRANKAVCWGEVTRAKGLKTWHGPSKSFLLEAVEIGLEQPKTQAFVDSLFFQTIEGQKAEGFDIEVRRTARGNIRATNYGKK